MDPRSANYGATASPRSKQSSRECAPLRRQTTLVDFTHPLRFVALTYSARAPCAEIRHFYIRTGKSCARTYSIRTEEEGKAAEGEG